jgi:tetratricopeptide (TPR) repeat protein
MVHVGASTARAQTAGPPSPDPRKEAVALYDQAVKHYNVGEYDEAVAAFKRAYLITEAPELLYDIAQSYRLKGPGSCTQAVQAYRSYLRVAPATAKRKSVEAAIRDMEECVRNEPPPIKTEPPAKTAEHEAAPERPTPIAPADPPRGRSWIGPIVAGAGLAVVGAGGALVAWSRHDYSSLRDSGCAPGCSPGAVDGPRHMQTAGDVLLVAGAVAVVTGVVLWFAVRAPAPTTGALDGAIRF